ncbi:AfsR/SARP family transcriptional regulator [Nocardia sp. NPDC052566]|uniref:AfsR/SARP family transcriptional regulator n=1 Tax=Nocardia sp. NPDC052566 TaxID=3364330 RepID=UPI0037CACF39
MTVQRGDAEVATGRPRTQAVLAALLLAGGRPLTAAQLIDAVWGDQPPGNAIGSLRSHIALLRKVIEPDRAPRDAATVLVSVGDGYEVRVEGEAMDCGRAEALAEAAETARGAREFEQARQLLTQALALWRGEPLAGVPGPFAESQRRRLSELRVTLLEARFDLDLQLGKHDRIIGELTVLSAEFPMRERPRGLLMTALYYAGRRAEALAVYGEARRTLIEELGIEPGPYLAELHSRILDDDLPAPVAVLPVSNISIADPRQPETRYRDDARQPPGDAVKYALPAQLPADIRDFTGRERQVGELVDLLEPSETAPVLAVVTGMGGIGKTTLAVHVAHLLADRYPDGRFYVDLCGVSDVPAEPTAVLGALLRALGVGEGAIPADGAGRSVLLRARLATRKVLLILDNARDAAQVAALLPAAPGTAAAITSRSTMVDLVGAQLVPVDVLDQGEALALFRGIVGADRVAAELDAAHAITAACGLLPLAIRIIAARLAARPLWSIGALAARLADEGRRMGELRLGSAAVETTFRFSYRHLDGEQARAFRLLSVPATQGLSLAAAAAVLDRDEYRTEELCEALVDLGLLQSPQPGRYRYHDLLRLFARTLTGEDQEGEEGVLPRLLDFLLATAKNVLRVRSPGHRDDHLAATVAVGEPIDNLDQAAAWLGLEQPTIIALGTQIAADHPEHASLSIDLALAVAATLETSRHSPHRAQALRALIDAADRHGDRVAAARGRAALAFVLTMDLGEPEEAYRLALETWVALTEFDDRFVLAEIEHLLGLLHYFAGRFDDAVSRLRTAIEMFAAMADRWCEGQAAASLALCHGDAAQWDQCAVAADRALLIARELGTSDFESVALQELSRVALERDGDTDRALALSEQAVGTAEARGSGRIQGWALLRFADARLRAGRLEAAESAAAEAVRVLSATAGPAHQADAVLMHSRTVAALDATRR